MAGKEEVIASTFEVKDIQKKYALFKAAVGLVCPDFTVPALDPARLTKAMEGGKHAANFVVAWDGKHAKFSIEAGSKVVAASKVDVFGDTDRTRRNRMTAGLVKLKVMSQSDAGKLERQTLTPDRVAIDALKKRKHQLETEIDAAQKALKQVNGELVKLEKAEK